MSDAINTKYVKAGFATSDDVVLSTTPTTRTVFRPGVHGGGVRGQIIRQKKGSNGEWKEVNEVDFRRLPADCGVTVELDTEATNILYSRLSQLYDIQQDGVSRRDERYVFAREREAVIINDRNKASAIRALLDQGCSEEFWRELSRSDPNLATKLALARIQFDRQEAIKVFERALVTHRDKESFWQSFFEANPWMLQHVFSVPVFFVRGEAYLGGKSPDGRQGKGGVATDFLLSDETTKSFAVIDIKTPGGHLVGARYRGKGAAGLENEIYSMHPDLTGGIVQVRNQIAVAVDSFSVVLGKYHKMLNRIHPKGILITGLAAELAERQKDSFNHFRQGQHGLTVITFDEFLRLLKLIFCEGAAPG